MMPQELDQVFDNVDQGTCVQLDNCDRVCKVGADACEHDLADFGRVVLELAEAESSDEHTVTNKAAMVRK